jgi:putative endonuclease
MAKHNEVGNIGEKVASEYLKSKGHVVIFRNYRKPYGEIDIVSKNAGIVHFVEVKTVSHETSVGSGTGDFFRPEENVHQQKVKRLLRTIGAYLFENGENGEWQFDVVAVILDQNKKTAKVRFLENVVLGS